MVKAENKSEETKTINPVAYIFTDFKDKFGIPRQSGRASKLMGKIVFKPEFSDKDFLRGIEEFSHLWLVFGFSKAQRTNNKENICPTVRPPRLGGNKRVGVFASRSPFRPNGLGLSCVKLEKIETGEAGKKNCIWVSGVDILNGTPIYDIKPYIPYADSRPEAKGGYAEDNKEHSLRLEFPESLLEIIAEDKRKALMQCLSDDPRPSYQQNPERIYVMNFAEYEIKFKVCGDILKVVETKIKGESFKDELNRKTNL